MPSAQSYLESAQSPQHGPNAACRHVSVGAKTSDLSLVRRAKLGERGAFDLLVMKYQRRIVKLAMRYTRNPSDAEDASQETFFKAYKGLQDFRCDSTFYTWLHRIAINCATNVLRARARDPALTAIDVPNAEDAVDLPTRLRDLETPEDLTVTDDICDLVNATLNTLPDGHRTAIILREIDGLTYEQIAAAMATPVGTVRSRLFRAREVISHQLRRVYAGGLGRRDRRRSRPTGAP